MATDHVLFFPFKKDNCIVQNGNDLKHYIYKLMDDPKSVAAYTLDAKYTPDAVRPQLAEEGGEPLYKAGLRDLKAKETLYIIGHCGAGQQELGSPDEKVRLSIPDLVKLLDPLPREWPGRIKCYCCESYLPSEVSITFLNRKVILGRSQSFAKTFLDAVRVAGYKNLSVFGYTHEVATSYAKDEKTGESHKFLRGERSSKYLQKVQ